MNNSFRYSFRFGDYLLEVFEKRLWRGDKLVSLTPKAFETLVVLVSNAGSAVEKEVLLQEVWADTFVEEGVLAQNILTLRKVFGNNEPDNRFIETVPRTGYRFTAEVEKISDKNESPLLKHRVVTETPAEHNGTPTDNNGKLGHIATAIEGDSAANPQRRSRAVATAFVITASLVVGVLSLIFHALPAKYSVAKFTNIDIVKLTHEGNVFRASISPDGNYAAIVEIHGEEYLLSVKQVDTSGKIEIYSSKKPIVGATFSPDGKYIYFTGYGDAPNSEGFQIGYLHRIPMLGGPPQEVVADIDSPVAISPDSQRIAFFRNHPKEKLSALVTASIDGKDERIIAKRDWIEAFSFNGLSWSPDGRTVACASYAVGDTGRQMEIQLVDIESGELRSLTDENWLWVGQIDWLTDGSGVVFPGWRSGSSSLADDIWLAPLDGKARQISSGVNGVFSLNLTADSNALLAVKSDRLTDFWTAEKDDLTRAGRFSQGHAEYNRSFPGLGFSYDGRIVYGSTFNGNLDIWVMGTGGNEKSQLTNDPAADFFPVISHDNSTIVFISNRTGRENLWRMRMDGNKQEQLTSELHVSSPSIGPDNRSVFYTSWEPEGRRHVLRAVDIETGQSRQLTSLQTSYPRVSPDGKYIACYFPGQSEGHFDEQSLKVTILQPENGQIIRQFDAPLTQSRLSTIEWKGNESLSFITVSNGNAALWEQPVNGDKPAVLLDLPKTSVFRFAWSPDGSNLVYEKGSTINNAILIRSR